MAIPVGQTVFSMVAGISLISSTAFLVESSAPSPPFNPSGDRFNQNLFYGRFCKMFLACDPLLLTKFESEVNRCQALLAKSATHSNSVASMDDGTTDRDLWQAKRTINACVHPDTGETVPQPFRMSGYLPYNGPISTMMVASTTTPSLLFFAWLNQSQNALVNYFNRNANSPMSIETLTMSYAGAVGSALTVALGLSAMIKKRFPDKEKAARMMKFIAFPSSVLASSLNCYIVRSPEIKTGIPLRLDPENKLGYACEGLKSNIAAARGVNETTASRALLQAPVYFLPPVLMSALPPIKNALAKNPRLSVPITTFLLLISFGAGLPATVAMFPQISEIGIDDVEPEFKAGVPAGTLKLYYDKGL
ncbi:hypothetical protein ScalyP_jg8927 [Parmales sp. scaly parma]|nr:hypothetical protein ScalyP_jg8927 [Parmales sp. scaly parma]